MSKLPGFLTGGIGIVVVVIAVILGWVVVPNIIEDKINEQVSLVENTSTWKKWVNNPVPIFLKFYFFNVTNPLAIENEEKPILKEVGPYVYQETREKKILNIDKDNDTITYQQVITYEFRRDMSIGSDEDLVTVVNGAFMSVITVIYGKVGSDTVSDGLLQHLLDAGESFVKPNVKVRDVLFDGFELPQIYAVIFYVGSIEIPPEYEGLRFGYYRGKNGSNDGTYTVGAGVKDSSNFGKIMSWNNKTDLGWWYPPSWAGNDAPDWPNDKNFTYCNMINGTDGSIFAPFITKDTFLRTFVSDVCRSIYLVYKEEIEHRGIPGYKFGFPDEFFQGPAENKENFCFCTTPTTKENVTLVNTCNGGAIRVFPCKSNGPIVTSSPHFLNAWGGYQYSVVGLKAEQHKHETVIYVEPNSGMMLHISKKVQINLEIQKLKGFKYFDRVQHFLFPAFWAEQTVELDNDNAEELKSLLVTPLLIVEIGKWTVGGIGVLMVAIGGLLLIFLK